MRLFEQLSKRLLRESLCVIVEDDELLYELSREADDYLRLENKEYMRLGNLTGVLIRGSV